MPQVSITITDKVAKKIDQFAAEKSVGRTMYATFLFDAAYAARCGVAHDLDLDAQIGMIMILHSKQVERLKIASVVGLKPETVDKIIETWRDEFGRRSKL